MLDIWRRQKWAQLGRFYAAGAFGLDRGHMDLKRSAKRISKI